MSMIIDGTNGITFNNSTVQASAGSVLQIQSGTISSSVNTSSSSFVTTGLTASITPKFNTSKILIQIVGGYFDTASTTQLSATIYRNSTNLAGSNSFLYVSASNGSQSSTGLGYIDSPATTSSTSYTLYIASIYTAGSVALGVPSGGKATIILTEIAG